MGDLPQESKAYALALVHAYVTQNMDYASWVPPHRAVRWGRRRCDVHVTQVNGHWRRKALYKAMLTALTATTKFETLCYDPLSIPPRRRCTWRYVDCLP